MIVGLSGKKQSGKNLVAKIWQLLDIYFNNRKLYNAFNREDKMSGKPNESYTDFIIDIISNNKTIWIDKNSWEQKSFAYKLKQIVCLLIGCTMEQLEDPVFKEKKLGKEWEVWYSETIYNLYICKEDVIKYQGDLKDYKQGFLTPRKLLQLIGTNCFRDLIHPEIWVNALFSEYTGIKYKFFSGNYSCKCKHCKKDFTGAKLQPLCLDCCNLEIQYPNWLITDVRFKNEAESILNRKGLLIRVERFCYDSAEDYCILHPNKEVSKQGLYIEENYHSSDEFMQRITALALANGYIPLKEQHISETALDDYDKFNYTIYNAGSIENLIEKVKEIMIKEGFIDG